MAFQKVCVTSKPEATYFGAGIEHLSLKGITGPRCLCPRPRRTQFQHSLAPSVPTWAALALPGASFPPGLLFGFPSLALPCTFAWCSGVCGQDPLSIPSSVCSPTPRPTVQEPCGCCCLPGCPRLPWVFCQLMVFLREGIEWDKWQASNVDFVYICRKYIAKNTTEGMLFSAPNCIIFSEVMNFKTVRKEWRSATKSFIKYTASRVIFQDTVCYSTSHVHYYWLNKIMQIVITSNFCNLIKPFHFWNVFLLEFMDNPLPFWQDRFIISGSSDKCHVSSDNESVTSLGSLFNDLVTAIFSSDRDANVPNCSLKCCLLFCH